MENAANKCGALARFFDFIFVAGFAVLAVFYCILWLPNKDDKHKLGIADYVLLGYWIFFALFMLGVVLRLEVMLLNFGFIDHVLYKSLFYIL